MHCLSWFYNWSWYTNTGRQTHCSVVIVVDSRTSDMDSISAESQTSQNFHRKSPPCSWSCLSLQRHLGIKQYFIWQTTQLTAMHSQNNYNSDNYVNMYKTLYQCCKCQSIFFKKKWRWKFKETDVTNMANYASVKGQKYLTASNVNGQDGCWKYEHKQTGTNDTSKLQISHIWMLSTAHYQLHIQKTQITVNNSTLKWQPYCNKGQHQMQLRVLVH